MKIRRINHFNGKKDLWKLCCDICFIFWNINAKYIQWRDIQNYILRIIYVFSFFFFFFFFPILSNFMFSTFYFGKLVSWWLAFNLFSVFHEFFIKYHYNIYICFLYKCHLVIIIFYIYKNSVFTNVSKNMLPQNFWVN